MLSVCEVIYNVDITYVRYYISLFNYKLSFMLFT